MPLNVLMVKKWHADDADSQAKTRMNADFFSFLSFRRRRNHINNSTNIGNILYGVSSVISPSSKGQDCGKMHFLIFLNKANLNAS